MSFDHFLTSILHEPLAKKHLPSFPVPAAPVRKRFSPRKALRAASCCSAVRCSKRMGSSWRTWGIPTGNLEILELKAWN